MTMEEMARIIGISRITLSKVMTVSYTHLTLPTTERV